MKDPYVIRHRMWDTVNVHEEGEGVLWRSVITTNVEIHRLEFTPGGRCEIPARPGTWTLQVLDGEVTVTLLGNRMPFDFDRYGMIPPNVPFSLEATSRRGAMVCLVHSKVHSA